MKTRHKREWQGILLFFCFIIIGNLATQAQSSSIDSLSTTPFSKGRWLTGLDGTISSNVIEVRGEDAREVTNQFGINLTSGKFIKNKWLMGGTLQVQRANNVGTVENTTETLFIGPLSNYYLSNSEVGSLFFQLSPGYVLYRDETTFTQLDDNITSLGKGSGFGTIFGMGYSYVINNRIAFDLAFNLNFTWVNLDTESNGVRTTDSIFINDTTFSFGFNVLLDDFFF